MSTVHFYKIVCFLSGNCYVGSTCLSLPIRLQKHKHKYREYLKKKIPFHPSFMVLQRDNYQIQLIESAICPDKKMRNTIEALYVLNEEAVNQRPPVQDIKEYNRQYYKDNKEEIKQKKNELIICSCNGRYTKAHKARHMKTKKHIAFEKQN